MGYWQDEEPLKELGEWMRAAVGRKVSRDLRVVRFGDNMREVAVTEGDKVEAQIKLGWQVNTWPVGELVDEIGKVTEEEVDALLDEYRAEYVIATDRYRRGALSGQGRDRDGAHPCARRRRRVFQHF